MIEIKTKAGATKLSIPINVGAKRKFELMKEDHITLPFVLATPIRFKRGDYVDCDFGLFEVVDLQSPTRDNKTNGFAYKLRLDAHYWKWKNKIFKFTPEAGGQEVSWTLTNTLSMHLDIILRNLAALGYKYKGVAYTYSIDSSVTSEVISLSYSNMNIIDSLTAMAEACHCEWWVTDSIIHFGTCEIGTAEDAILLETDNNVSKMDRKDSQSDFASRIIAFGSDRNIPSGYREDDEHLVIGGIVQKRLMLPAETPYIDAEEGLTTEEAVEKVVTFDDIYPRRTGVIDEVSTKEYEDTIENEDGTTTKKKWNAYRFTDDGIIFSKEYILPTQDLKITFMSGSLQGLTFQVAFNPDNEPEHLVTKVEGVDAPLNVNAQIWEILRNEDYGVQLPSDDLCPEEGDEYVLSGYDTSFVADTMMEDAEQELKTRAEEYVEKSKIDPSTYNCTLMSDWVYEDQVSRVYGAGTRVKLIDVTYFDTPRISRVLGYEFNMDYPYDSPMYIIGESSAYSRLGALEEKLESINYQGASYNGGGNGGGSGSNVYLIRANDSTPPSDSNAYSALRALKTFIRKDANDTVAGLLSLLRGLILADGSSITSEGYTSGALGSGLAIKTNENGESYIEVDHAVFRKTATFFKLMIQELKSVGGMISLTPASLTCSEVVELEDGYKCFFSTSDGDKTISNTFEVGDQARRQTFNISAGESQNASNEYYWRLVTAVGDNYIVLSKTDCDAGSTVPKAGDEIVQLGNRNNEDRQGAIILSSYGEGSPYIKLYKGINGYTLAGKERIDLNPNNIIMKVDSLTVGANDIDVEETLNEHGLTLDSFTDDGTFSIVEKNDTRVKWYEISGVASTTANPTTNGSYASLMAKPRGSATTSDYNDARSDLSGAFDALKTYLNGVKLYENTPYKPFNQNQLAQKLAAYAVAYDELERVISKGNKGAKGDDGANGTDGRDGVDGQNGQDGQNGADGINGQDGEKGDKGDKGDKGNPFTYDDFTPEQLEALKGVDGQDGTSITWLETTTRPTNPSKGQAYYDAARKMSYVWFDAWYQMSKDGEDGRDGLDGINGVDGTNGINGQDGADGASIVWKGESSTPPLNPQKNWYYRDTDNGIVYIYNGDAWEVVVADGSNGTNGSNGSDGYSVYITYHDGESEPNNPTGDGTSNGWHTNATNAVKWISQKVSSAVSEGAWGDPIPYGKGDKGDQGEQGLQGLQGEKGETGIQGDPGANGLSSYFHIAYADDINGGGFSQVPTDKDYIGTYSDYTETDAAASSNLWKWQLVKGAQGEKGDQGIAGVGIDGETYYLHIAYADNEYGGGFDTESAEGKTYIGTYTDTNINDASAGSPLWKWAKIKGDKGDQGEQGKSIVPLYAISDDAAPTIPTEAVTSLPTGWSRNISEAGISKKMISSTGDWERNDTDSAARFIAVNGVVSIYTKRKMRLKIATPTATSISILMYKGSTLGAMYIGYVDQSLSESLLGVVSNYRYKRTASGGSSYVVQLEAGVSYIDIWYYRESTESAAAQNAYISIIDLHGAGDLNKQRVWVSQALYDGESYEFTEPYATVEPSKSTPLDETFKTGNNLQKGAAIVAGALIVTNISDNENVTNENIVGLMKGSLGDGIFQAAHESDAYSKAYDFTQGLSSQPPKMLVTDRGDAYYNSIQFGSKGFSDNCIVTPYSVALRCNTGNGGVTAISSQDMPSLTKTQWLSQGAISAGSARTYTAASLEAKLEAYSAEITVSVPSMLSYGIGMQGDLRRYIVQKYNVTTSTWVDLQCEFLQVTPINTGVNLSSFVINGRYRIKCESQSFNKDASALPGIQIYSLSATPTDGTFSYSNGVVEVYNIDGVRCVRGSRNGVLFDYRPSAPDNIIYHPNGYIEQWGVVQITSTSQWVYLPVPYQSLTTDLNERFNVQVTADNYTGSLVQTQARVFVDYSDRFMIVSSATGFSVHWRTLGKPQN